MWSLGITAIEIAEGKPPLHGVVEPMRAGHRVLKDAAPALSDGDHWSKACRCGGGWVRGVKKRCVCVCVCVGGREGWKDW